MDSAVCLWAGRSAQILTWAQTAHLHCEKRLNRTFNQIWLRHTTRGFKQAMKQSESVSHIYTLLGWSSYICRSILTFKIYIDIYIYFLSSPENYGICNQWTSRRSSLARRHSSYCQSQTPSKERERGAETLSDPSCDATFSYLMSTYLRCRFELVSAPGCCDVVRRMLVVLFSRFPRQQDGEWKYPKHKVVQCSQCRLQVLKAVHWSGVALL